MIVSFGTVLFFAHDEHQSTVLKNIALTDKILSTSVSFAGGQNLETAEAKCRICFGGTKE